MWKLAINKAPTGQQEVQVHTLLKEMADGTYASYAEQFENHFKLLIKDTPKTNSFSADLLYRVTHRNMYSVEVWKMTPAGDFKHKMFTLDYVR